MITPIDDQKIMRLWGYLETQFNVAVNSIGSGMDSNNQRQAVVGVDENTDDAVIQTLPMQFEGDNVIYEKVAQASGYNW